MDILTERGRTLVWFKTAAITGGYLAAVWLVYLELAKAEFISSGLSLAVAFGLVQCAAIILLLTGSFCVKRVNELRHRLTGRVAPSMRNALAMYAAGSGRLGTLQRFNSRYSRNLEQCLIDFLSSTTGEPHNRLSTLAVGLGFVERWESRRLHGRARVRRKAIAKLTLLAATASSTILISALEDKDQSVQIDAARALLREGGIVVAETVFYSAMRNSLLIRAILAEDLRPHALSLCNQAIPASLASENPKLVLDTLQLLEAWQTSLPLPGIYPLLKHDSPEIRAGALRLLPYNSQVHGADELIVQMLEDNDEGVRTAAAFVAGKMQVGSALTSLAASLRHSNDRLAKASAGALAEFGPLGWKELEHEILHGTHASAAMEALESAQVND